MAVVTAAPVPRHIAIVMDGNGRWAKERGLSRVEGHKAGGKVVKNIVRICVEQGIEVLTLFAFSTENWGRPKQEVSALMRLFLRSLQQDTKELHENNIRLKIIGDRSALSFRLQKNIIAAEQLTANNTAMMLNIALNYSGRWDIITAMREIAVEISQNKLAPDAIIEEVVRSHLCGSELPEPDLFIRTSGEQRISNFMLWQLAYTELYFTETFWPDFDELELSKALQFYAGRIRRFGKIND